MADPVIMAMNQGHYTANLKHISSLEGIIDIIVNRDILPKNV